MDHCIDTLLKSLVKILAPETDDVIGSGFIIRHDGYLVTCHHVIFHLNKLKVEYQGITYEAQWCKEISDPDVDIAVLKIEIDNAYELSIIDPLDLPDKPILCGFPRSKIENFPEGYVIHPQKIYRSSPVNTLSTYPPSHNIKYSNPWNILPQKESTFRSLSIDKKVELGISGGPFFSEELCGVIGVIQSTAKNMSYAIRWENISGRLKKLGISLKNKTVDLKNVENKKMNIAEILAEKYDYNDLRSIAKQLGMPLSKIKPNATSLEFALDIDDWVIREKNPELLKKLRAFALHST